MERVDTLILGAGISGLAAAWELGDQATVLERQTRPGGLVQSARMGDYWFDHVLHLLYFNSPQTERRVRALLGERLAPCRPIAWVETAKGVARFPLQLHLGSLERDTVVEALRDLAEISFSPHKSAANYEEMLLQSFGPRLCELFFFPYNRKVWKRPLHSLAASGFSWNIAKPDFITVLRNAISTGGEQSSYNARGWYPRPEASSDVRGMEVLSRAIAAEVPDLRLNHEIVSIELANRRVTTEFRGKLRTFEFQHSCVATVPLPKLFSLCADAPESLRNSCAKLLRNRVLTGIFAIKGERPSARGHWRYYPDESVVFTRVVYMHEFDPNAAPEDGWGLLVEITDRAETPLEPEDVILNRIEVDLQRTGVLSPDDRIIGRRLLMVDPAYVVFTSEPMKTVQVAREFLAAHDVHCLGRYGRWEYSSMSQVMTDGFELGRDLSRGREVLFKCASRVEAMTASELQDHRTGQIPDNE